MLFYVYLLLDPRNFYLPFYVGKGSGERYRDHLTETIEQTCNKRKHYKIVNIRKRGLEPKVLFWETGLTEKEAYALETQLIIRFGRSKIDDDGILTNICLNAQPPGFLNCLDQNEFRRKISEATSGCKNGFYGKKHSVESRLKIGLAHKGKTISEQQKHALSKKLIGRIVSDDVKKKISEAHKGKPKSEQHKEKIGNAHRGKTISIEQRAKICKALTGKKRSADTIEKMRNAARLREQRKREKRDDDDKN